MHVSDLCTRSVCYFIATLLFIYFNHKTIHEPSLLACFSLAVSVMSFIVFFSLLNILSFTVCVHSSRSQWPDARFKMLLFEFSAVKRFFFTGVKLQKY